MDLDHLCRYMYPACIPHVSCISDTYLSRYIWDTCIPLCILEVFRMYPSCILEPLQIHLSRMYPACILHVSCISDLHVSCMYPRTSADTCIPHVFLMFSACIPCVSRMYPECIPHVSLMYRTCVPRRCAYLATATGACKGDEEGKDCCRASRPAH